MHAEKRMIILVVKELMWSTFNLDLDDFRSKPTPQREGRANEDTKMMIGVMGNDLAFSLV